VIPFSRGDAVLAAQAFEHDADLLLGREMLGEEAGPGDLIVPFPFDLMVMWPVSRRVNRAGTEGADLLDPIDLGGPE